MTNREPTNNRINQVQLPLHANVAIYRSTATSTQVPPTTDKIQVLLIAFAKQLGWTEDHIIQLAQDEGLQTLFACIERDEIKAVLTANETFLFRDAVPAQVNDFMRLCQEHQVLFLTPERTYIFRNPLHVLLFRAKSESWFHF